MFRAEALECSSIIPSQNGLHGHQLEGKTGQGYIFILSVVTDQRQYDLEYEMKTTEHFP